MSGSGSNIAHLSPEDIAKWPAPNYENPDRLTWMPAYSSIWFIAATLLFGMRCWLRVRGHAGRLGLDDAILLPGWLAGLWFTVVTMLYSEWGGSLHVWDTKTQKRTDLVLFMWLGEFSFLVCGGCTKVSILLFYRRLVGGTYSRRYKWLIWFAIAFTIAYTVVFCIILLINCTPTEAYWMAFDFKYASTADYTCMDTSVINTMAGVCAAISDVYAVALPCILTWQLSSVPKRQKIALFGIFSLGLVVVAASGVRTYWLIQTSKAKDITRAAFNLFVWAQFELQAGIICASAPSLRVFFRRYLGGSNASRITRETTPNPNKSLGTGTGTRTSNHNRSATAHKDITVVRDLSVTYEQDSTESTESLNAIDRSPMEAKPTWSPIRNEGNNMTRYSHEEDSFVMGDLSWKRKDKEPKWPGHS